MKATSLAVSEHCEIPLADQGQLEQILSFWQQRKSRPQTVARVRSYVLSVGRPVVSHGQLQEILGLVEAQGDECVGYESYALKQPNPHTLLGPGVMMAVAQRALAAGATMLVLDAELSPSQMRNLEQLTCMSICDREAVILHVFLRHAHSPRARQQVELAQLQYLRPRIRGLGLNMDQQAGGIMGGRGPGETASELLARRLDARLAQLNQANRQANLAAKQQRQNRANCLRLVLLGYTNAGKTSLMNALTNSQLSARPLPFETLDTTTRILAQVAGQTILLSDTVGFIRNLPERLFASFASTLSEVCEADLLLLVVDVSDPEYPLHLATTEQMLHKLGAQAIPRVYVYNKADLLLTTPAELHQPNILLCSQNNTQIEALKQLLIQQLLGELSPRQLFIPYTQAARLKRVYQHCQVLAQQSDEQGWQLTVLTSETQWELLR